MHRDDLTVEKSTPGAREIDRRTIAKGVAWTVPVVIVATAAPAQRLPDGSDTVAIGGDIDTPLTASRLPISGMFRIVSGSMQFLPLTLGTNS